jgi:hypothetical protein
MRKGMVDAAYRSVMWLTRNGHHIAHVLDPDGNYIELYDHPESGHKFSAPKIY